MGSDDDGVRCRSMGSHVCDKNRYKLSRFFFSRFVLYDLHDVPRITFKMDITQRQNVDEVVLKIKIKLKVKQICQALILLNLGSVRQVCL